MWDSVAVSSLTNCLRHDTRGKRMYEGFKYVFAYFQKGNKRCLREATSVTFNAALFAGISVEA